MNYMLPDSVDFDFTPTNELTDTENIIEIYRRLETSSTPSNYDLSYTTSNPNVIVDTEPGQYSNNNFPNSDTNGVGANLRHVIDGSNTINTVQSSSDSIASAEYSSKLKRKRFTWTDDLHRQFVEAIFEHGLKNATPKAILSSMTSAPSDLTTEHIKSHLQKYRSNSEKSKQDFMEKYCPDLNQHNLLKRDIIDPNSSEDKYLREFLRLKSECDLALGNYLHCISKKQRPNEDNFDFQSENNDISQMMDAQRYMHQQMNNQIHRNSQFLSSGDEYQPIFDPDNFFI